MALRVYNTLSRQKEEFKTVRPGRVGMYVCGPTVYKPSHIGHMVGPVIFDTVRRYLNYVGYEVDFVVNITDVDDKLIVRARELGTTVKELSERMTADYLDCLKQLGVECITHLPRATEHIPEMLTLITGLIDKGYAYPAGGDVYFDVTSDEDYGKLCNRDPEQMEAGARVEVSDRKRNPGDFALWKGAKPGEPSWESPWGPGRPGWHIECSAMSMRYLGETLDIHGGGLDLQFPHHENELAQSESFTGKPFSRYWMHNGLMKMGHAKMAGSVGNVINVVDLLQKHHPETVRLLLLGTHYRSPIEYSEERLGEVRRSLEGFYRFFERYERITKESFYTIVPPQTRQEHEAAKDPEGRIVEGESSHLAFCAHMEDDFNTGGAVGTLYELLTQLNRFADQHQEFAGTESRTSLAYRNFRYGAGVLRELASLLGLFREPITTSRAGDDKLVNGLMQLLIDLRADARKSKNFAVADQIRKRLTEIGVTLEDRAGETGWRVG
jgi:cysteinyl-tRNA synthetase